MASGRRAPRPLPFTKMHGLGNDFMVCNATRRPVHLDAAQIRLMADRHCGVGFDQLLMVEASPRAGVDFRYRIFNADGSEAGQCGNGARCFARFVRDHGLTDKERVRVETISGIIELELTAAGRVVVNMGVPKFLPAEIPFLAPAAADSYVVEVATGAVELMVVNMGNPHAVVLVDAAQTAPVQELGAALESHPRFPERVNVGFAQVVSRASVNLRVYERGVGETLACGTGACAAVAAGRRRGLLEARVCVHLPGGELFIDWPGGDAPVLMEGPASRVYEGLWMWP